MLVLRAKDFPLFRWIVSIQDGFHLQPPFGDLGAILLAGACWRHGVDVYGPNACMGGGEFNYSPLLLRLAYLPIGPADRAAGGVLVCLAFFGSICLLPRPKSARDMLFRAACVLSPACVFALGQANFDVLIFVLAGAGAALVARSRILAACGYGIFAVLAAAKFYPVAALGLLLRERRAVVTGAAILLGAAGLLFCYLYGAGLEAVIVTLPEIQPFRATFGAIDLPLGLIMLHLLPAAPFDIRVAQFDAKAAGAAGLISAPVLADGLMALALLAGAAARRRYQAAFDALDPRVAPSFLTGALMIVFSFAFAQNFYYRAIFLILTVPGLWDMAGGAMRRRFLILLSGVMLLLWQAAVIVLIGAGVPGLIFWLLREGLWWWVIIQFLAILFSFFAASAARLRQAWHE